MAELVDGGAEVAADHGLAAVEPLADDPDVHSAQPVVARVALREAALGRLRLLGRLPPLMLICFGLRGCRRARSTLPRGRRGRRARPEALAALVLPDGRDPVEAGRLEHLLEAGAVRDPPVRLVGVPSPPPWNSIIGSSPPCVVVVGLDHEQLAGDGAQPQQQQHRALDAWEQARAEDDVEAAEARASARRRRPSAGTRSRSGRRWRSSSSLGADVDPDDVGRRRGGPRRRSGRPPSSRRRGSSCRSSSTGRRNAPSGCRACRRAAARSSRPSISCRCSSVGHRSGAG